MNTTYPRTFRSDWSPIVRTVELFVPGEPAPQGSKRHVGGGRMIESSAAVGPWRDRVALDAHNGMRQFGLRVFDGPVTVHLTFVLRRPKSAPKSHTPPATKRPDIDKLTRAVLDAITGVCIADDSQVVNLHATKRIAEPNEMTGVNIQIQSETT